MNERKTVSEGNKKVMRTKRTDREHSHVRERADGKSVWPAANGLATNRTSLNKEEERQGCYRQQRERGRERQGNAWQWGGSQKTLTVWKDGENDGQTDAWWTEECTWLSTSMAMSTNMSCSSFMLLSRRTMSLWRASISLSACLEIPESTIYNTNGWFITV